MIIAICHNETGSLSLTVLNFIHNYSFTLPGALFTNRNLIQTNKVKNLITFQTRVGASGKQVIIAIQNDTNTKNLLVKPKGVYNKHETQRQKQLSSLTSV